MEIIYYKRLDLGANNNNTINISENNAVEGQTFIGGEEYLISGIELRPKTTDFTKWKDYDKIKAIPDRINPVKRNNEGKFNLPIVAKLNNIIGEKNRFLRLKKNKQKKTYKYRNTKTKKIGEVSFQNFQKLFEERELTWVDEKFEYSLFISNGKLIQLLTKKFNESDYLDILFEYYTFWVLVNGKTFSSVNWIWYFYKRMEPFDRILIQHAYKTLKTLDCKALNLKLTSQKN